MTLEVGIVEVPSRSVRVLTERGYFGWGEGDVTLTSSTGYIGGHIEPDLRVFGDGVFSIWWDGARYPWIDFAKTEAPEWVSGAGGHDWWLVSEAYLNLSRIVRVFSTSHRRELRPLWGPLLIDGDHLFARKLRNNKILAIMFEWLAIEQFIVYDRFLDPRKFAEHGITLRDIFARRETPQLQAFVGRFLITPAENRTSHR